MNVQPRIVAILGAGLYLFALLFRFIGIGWGLKNDLHDWSYHPDEPVILGFSQAIDPAHGKFTPGHYNYGTFYLTGLKITSDVVAAYTGGPDPKDASKNFDYYSRVTLAGRVVSAFAGAGTVLLVFLMLRRWTGLVGASFGALLIAVAPGFVVHSRFQTVDVTATFFLAAGTYAALATLDTDAKRGLKMAALSGLWFGLSAGTKYTGILGLVTLYVILFAAKRPAALKEALIGTAAALLAFVISTPGVILDREAFMRDFVYEMAHTSQGHGAVFTNTANGFEYHLINLFIGVGPILTLVGIAGLIWAAWKRKPEALAIGAFFLLYYLLIGRAEVKFLRYTFPLLIGLAAGTAWAVHIAHERGGRWKALVGLAILGIGGIDSGGMISAARMTAWMASEDPRDSAARYLKKEPTQAVGFALDPWFWSVPLWPQAGAPLSVPPEVRREERQASVPPVVLHEGPEGFFYFDKRLLTEDRPPRITMTSLEYFDFIRLKGYNGDDQVIRDQSKNATDFFAELDKDYVKDQSWGDDYFYVPVQDLMYIRPQVVVWKRKAP
ncbi:hypothetical protein BH11ARM2_BH11ARM2_15230 [soil metagenome]